MKPEQRRAGRAIRKRHRAYRNLGNAIKNTGAAFRKAGRSAGYATQAFERAMNQIQEDKP